MLIRRCKLIVYILPTKIVITQNSLSRPRHHHVPFRYSEEAPDRAEESCAMMHPEEEEEDGQRQHVSFRDATRTLAKRAVRLKSASAALAASDTSMKKCLTATDLLLLGVGGVVGGGVFVLTGAAAHDHAGPAVVISYILASLTSMITGLCYTEFAVETPVAGSAYNFVALAFGEFAGYLCGCNLALELTIAAAAVARGWTSYMATLFHAHPDALRIQIVGGDDIDDVDNQNTMSIKLDFPSAILVAMTTALLAYGMKETAKFNAVVTIVSLAVIGFVIIAGGLAVDSDNWTPFAPNGINGILAGASVVFFSFVGFDTVATCAEEVADPGRDLPIGIMGSLGIVAVLYALMSLVITGMVPSNSIDVDAPFALAFRMRNMKWAESIISFGAVAAITTALVSSLMGQPRVYMVMARDGLLPKWFAKVDSKLGTPINASVFTGVTTGVLSLIVDIEILAQLVSIGTLAIFASVCLGLLARRHTPEGEDISLEERLPALRRCFGLLICCAGFSATTVASGGGSGSSIVAGIFFGAAVASTVSFNSLPRYHTPTKGFCTPFVPYLPALGVLATVQLIMSLGPLAWARFVVYTVVCSALYVWYGAAGIRNGWDAHSHETGNSHAFHRMEEEDDAVGEPTGPSPFASTLYGDTRGLHLEREKASKDSTDAEIERGREIELVTRA